MYRQVNCSALRRFFCLLLFVLLLPGGTPSHSEPTRSLTEACTPDKLQRRLYVTTVDGTLTALDVSGRPLWHYGKGEPLFSSSLSQAKDMKSIPNLIPALDKNLYHWNGTLLSKLPFTADDLIDHASLSSGYGSALVGAKVSELVGINVNTGKPLYECTAFKCHRYDNKSLIHQLDVLKISISRVTVREANELNGEEIWNFTVANMELSVLEGMEDSDFNCGVSPLFTTLRFEVDTLRGVLIAIDNSVASCDGSNTILWEKKLSAPIVGVWQHEGGWLQQVLLSSHRMDGASFRDHTPLLMLVHYNSQYYIQTAASSQHSLLLGNELGKVPRLRDNSRAVDLEELREFIEAQQTYKMAAENGVWPESSYESGPGSGSDSVNFPLMPYYNDDVFLEMCTAGPNGLAIYFYLSPHYLDVASEECASIEENKSSDERETCLPPQNFVSSSSRRDWIISIGISSLQYTVFGMFVLCLNKLRRYHKRRKRLSSSTTSLEENEVEDDEEEFPLFDNIAETISRVRHSSSSSTIVGSSLNCRLPSSGSSTDTLASPGSQRRLDQVEGLARFGSDYDLIGRLGKGGFGIVYHVQNRFDGLDYAVKRIRLPSNKSSREKVMREVRALAQLDHPTIIRYYNSWVEKAPPDWNEMEEWMPLSRQPSIVYDRSPMTSSTQPSMAKNHSNSLSTPNGSSTISLSSLPSNLSPCPSFSSLNHSYFNSVVPPPKVTDDDSQSSSFVIEFREDSLRSHSGSAITPDGSYADKIYLNKISSSHSTCDEDDTSENLTSCDDSSIVPVNGCFSKALLSGRDELSFDRSTSSLSTTDDHEAERRDSITDLFVEPPTFLFIQMQLCQKESLKDWLASNITNRRRETVINYFDQVLDAVLYVHRKGMMHRDLKPSNIFFALDGGIKVGDFGLVTGSAFGYLHSSYVMLKSLPEESYRQHTGNLGSHFYMSPELMLGQKYDQKVDIFSLGVIFFELHYPFATEMERAKVLEDLRSGGLPAPFRVHLPLEANFVDWLMCHRRGNRPSAQEVVDSERWHSLKENVKKSEVDLVPKL